MRDPATRSDPTRDLLPWAQRLRDEGGHRVALLDSPPGTRAARWSHLTVLERPRLDGVPDPLGGPANAEHVCLATFDHGLQLEGVASRHAPLMGFRLAAYPVLARASLDRRTGRLLVRDPDRVFDELEPPTARVASDEVAAAAAAAAAAPALAPAGQGGLRRTHDRASFADMVEAAQAYIADGHSYQVNVSMRLDLPYAGDAATLFGRLRAANPSPYQALLDTPEASLASVSPELLVRSDGDRLVTRPIAGTRPRGRDRAHDRALEAELVASAKERAEHAMLVDLARNDLGRVSRFGTVRVADSAVVERYSHVMHLVSEVRGQLAQGRSAWDAFEAVFPCGTISGAPKRRSLEIIDELEPVSRGAYTGSLGLVTPDWSAWNILIRTAVLDQGRAFVQAGAGIVADSVAEREHDECLHKAQALLEVLGVHDAEARHAPGSGPGGATPWPAGA